MLKFLMEKVDNMQGWMGSIRREKKIRKKKIKC